MPHLRDARQLRERRERRGEHRLGVAHALEQALALEDVEVRERRDAGGRVARVRAAVEERRRALAQNGSRTRPDAITAPSGT